MMIFLQIMKVWKYEQQIAGTDVFRKILMFSWIFIELKYQITTNQFLELTLNLIIIM